MPRYHPEDAALGRATWSVGHYGEVFGVTAPEAYVPRMMDQEYAPEDNPGSFSERIGKKGRWKLKPSRDQRRTATIAPATTTTGYH